MTARIISVVSRVLTDMCSLLLFCIMILVGADVFMRYSFNAPIPGTLEISEQIVVFITFLCFAYTGMQARHVRTTVIVGRLPLSLKAAADFLCTLLMLALLSLLIWRTTIEAWRALTILEVRMGLIEVPLYPSKIAIPIGLAVAWLYYFFNLPSLFLKNRREQK